MDVLELLERLDGDILANKARVVVDGQIIDVGYFDGPNLVFTEAGKALADEQSNIPSKPPRKARAAAVESAEPAPEAAPEQ
ncbi:MAG: hypothetical protein EBZ22_11055 [Flavobacteriia bacterium]|jgi:hypothetical protein|nr:hypothetical protein [Flavobacteriia bacterium]